MMTHPCDAHDNHQLYGTGALADYLSYMIKESLGNSKEKLRVSAETLRYLHSR